MLLPIKLATTKQPAKKKGKVTPVTPEEQVKGFEGLKRQAQLEEQQIAEFIAKQNYNPAEEARKRGVSVPTQPYESKLNTGVLAEPVLSGEESVAKAQTEPKVAPRVQVNKQGLVVKTIETKYGNLKYTATPEESKIYLGSNIDAINKLTAEIAKDFENGFRQEGLKPKRQTKEKYKFDEVNAALNLNFIDEQTRKGVKAFEDVLLAPFDTFGIRKSLNEVADYAKQSDNALAQFGGGVLESVANPLTTFAMSTGNIADPTATTEQKVGAGLNLATYLVSAIPVGEAVSASINAYRGVRGLAGVGKGINAGAKSLLRSTVPGGKIINRKVTINDLVNVLERNGQMGGKTRGQLAREFASGGKAFAKATGQAPELFYNKYLNDLADQAQPATPAQFDVTASKAPEAPTQVEPEIPTQVEPEVITTPEPAPAVTPVVKEVFDWSNPANEQAVRDALYAYRKQQYPNASEKILQENVDSRIANLKDNPDINPFARFSENDQWIDIRNNQATSPLWTDVQTTPTPTLSTWDAPGIADKARTALTNYLKQRLADKNYSDEYIQSLVDKVIAKRAKGVDDNPFFIEIVNKETGTTQIIDPRTGQPTKKLLSELKAPTQVEDLGTVVDELTAQVESPVVTEPATPVVESPIVQEPVVQITETNRQRYNAIADADDAWLEEYFTRKMDSRQAGFNLDDYEAMARMARSFAIKYGYNTIDDAIQLVVKAWKQRTGIDINLTNADTQAIKQSIAKLESNAPPVTPPTSIVDEIEQGMGASKSTEPPVSSAMQAEQPPVPPTQTATTAIPEPGNVPIEVGISNKANLSAQELELISQAPQGQGKSASEVVEETINRNPSDKELEILAGKVANGQALNADDTAVLLVGQGRFNLRVFNAREALDNAIKSGASAQDIDQLRDAWLLAQADATNFAKQIQRGKSGWSDVGRVLQQKTDLFTGELSQIKANIIAQAELRKGRTLTDAEQENYKTMIDKLIGENKKLEEELAKLKATRSQATGEGRVRRTRTLDNLDKSIAQKENKIRVNKATVTQKLNNEIPVATSTRLGQFITEMKLLNPFSRFTDVESNTIKLIDNIVSTPFNMAVDQATSRLLKTQPVYSSSYLAKDRWKNLLINSWEKMKADFKIVAAGGDVETIEKYGGAQGLGSKAAGFTDVPFKAIYHEDGKFLAADVKAREMLAEELGKGNFGKRDIDAKRTEILENIDQHPDIIMNAEEYALNETFNNHNWVSEINKAVKGTVFKSPNARLAYDELIGRFSKVITNVAIDVADRTGLGVARGIYNIADAIKSGKNLTTAERMAINKMITKGMIGMPLMYLGIKNWDKIQGEIRGVQQKYIDYGDLGKLGGPIAIFLHGASIGRAMNELPPDKVNAFVTASSVKLPFNTPFVSNIADISDILDNPAPQALAKFAAKKLSNAVIPAVIREIATRMDTEKGIQTGMEPEREKAPKGASTAEIFKGEFMSKIPGLRQQLPLKGSGRQPVTPGVIP
jgi:hypothetical protein